MNEISGSNKKWYEGVTRYQWLVLTIASLGWMFDVFEGQIFVASMRDAMPALRGVDADSPAVSKWKTLKAIKSGLLHYHYQKVQSTPINSATVIFQKHGLAGGKKCLMHAVLMKIIIVNLLCLLRIQFYRRPVSVDVQPAINYPSYILIGLYI